MAEIEVLPIIKVCNGGSGDDGGTQNPVVDPRGLGQVVEELTLATGGGDEEDLILEPPGRKGSG